MTYKELSYHDLRIAPSDLYRQMGYADAVPDEAVLSETARIIREVESFLRPRFCFFVAQARMEGDELEVEHSSFSIGKIIARQLRGSTAYAFFICTAGTEYEQYQQRLKQEGDMVRTFIADALGSIIAERCADQMEIALQTSIDKLGWKHTNRFSPGYCGWHVSQQQLLFPLFGKENPCGVQLTESSLMIPIKSVSGLIGVGPDVRHLDYTCGLCDFKQCYKRATRIHQS